MRMRPPLGPATGLAPGAWSWPGPASTEVAKQRMAVRVRWRVDFIIRVLLVWFLGLLSSGRMAFDRPESGLFGEVEKNHWRDQEIQECG